jgi:hypothetical protein
METGMGRLKEDEYGIIKGGEHTSEGGLRSWLCWSFEGLWRCLRSLGCQWLSRSCKTLRRAHGRGPWGDIVLRKQRLRRIKLSLLFYLFHSRAMFFHQVSKCLFYSTSLRQVVRRVQGILTFRISFPLVPYLHNSSGEQYSKITSSATRKQG